MHIIAIEPAISDQTPQFTSSQKNGLSMTIFSQGARDAAGIGWISFSPPHPQPLDTTHPPTHPTKFELQTKFLLKMSSLFTFVKKQER